LRLLLLGAGSGCGPGRFRAGQVLGWVNSFEAFASGELARGPCLAGCRIFDSKKKRTAGLAVLFHCIYGCRGGVGVQGKSVGAGVRWYCAGRYTWDMAKSSKSAGKTAVRYVIGDANFAAITAVEGLHLSAEGEKRLKRAKSMSPAKRRAATIAAYKSARAR